MYNKVDTNMNFVDREKETEKFWRENDIFKKSMENRKEGETYTFYDGPPTANGKPHIGHVETRTIKDMIPRFQTMKGKYVPRKAGWDTHGLPVEIEVEKLLGLDGKDQIEAYGLEPFIKKCKESVWKYKGMWEDFSNTVGFWADMDNPYVTYDDNFIEMSSQSKFRRFMSSAVYIMEPFRMHSNTGASLTPLKSALIFSATLSMAFSSSSLEMKGLNVLSNRVIFSIFRL